MLFYLCKLTVLRSPPFLLALYRISPTIHIYNYLFINFNFRKFTFCLSQFRYSAFVLDANSYTLGQSACNANFASTNMGTEFTLQGVTLTCTAGQTYVITVMIDFVMATTLFLLWLAWARCTNLYNEISSSTSEDPSAPPLQTPILKSETSSV